MWCEKVNRKNKAPQPATSQKQRVKLNQEENETKFENPSMKESERANTFERKAIPRAIYRTVWQKAKSKCENCESTYALEIDHIFPIALGGENDAENLRLLCRSCNQRAAIEKLGVQTMQNFL